MPGCWTTSRRPESARAANQTPITGPNRRPTAPVPKRWMANRKTSTVREIGTTSELRPGAATFNPSTAESTEIAGVIIPSP